MMIALHLLLTSSANVNAVVQPNIVYFLVDDLGFANVRKLERRL